MKQLAAFLLGIGGDARRRYVSDGAFQKFQRSQCLRPINPHLARLLIDPEPAVTDQHFEIIADKTLILPALPDVSPQLVRALQRARDAKQLVEGLWRIVIRRFQQVRAEKKNPAV